MGKGRKEHFDISSHVVIQLGEELITDGLTALLELAKNSYDAESKFVKITINTEEALPEHLGYQWSNAGKGYVIVEDQGRGMSERNVRDSWLNIASSQKRILKKSGKIKEGERYPLGDKGLGRLSTQRIGRYLELQSVKDEAKTTVRIDWDQFQEDRKLSEIYVEFETEAARGVSNGTAIIISGIRNFEEFKEPEEIERKLLQLISPHEKAGFQVFAIHNGLALDLRSKIDQIRDLAIYQFEFQYIPNDVSPKVIILGKAKQTSLIAKRAERPKKQAFEEFVEIDNGKAFYEFLTNPVLNPHDCIKELQFENHDGWFCSAKWEIPLINEPQQVLFAEQDNCGSFRGFIDSFSLDIELDTENSSIQPQSSAFTKLGDFKSYISGQVGIRVYRDGFAIRPFGFDGNDWLRLGHEKTSGASYYSLRPGNTVGTIRISARDNASLLETTAREGLKNNGAFRNFHSILQQIIDKINKDFIERIRRSLNKFLSEKENAKSETKGKLTPAGEEIIRNAENVAQALLPKLEQEKKSVEEELAKVPKPGELLYKEEEHEIPRRNKEAELQRKQQEIMLANAAKEAEKAVSEVRAEKAKVFAMQDNYNMLLDLASLGMVAELLSHEIANIATNLANRGKAILDELRKDRGKNPDLLKYAEFVQTSTAALRKQISHLAPSLRYVHEKKDSFVIDKFMEAQVDFHKEGLQERGITIRLQLSAETGTVRMNTGRLSQVTDNLIKNAEYWLLQKMKSQPTFQGQILVSIEGKRILVQDNGYGVSRSIEDRLFQPFETTKPKGRGLGLYICEKLLEAVGGSIRLRGERNDHGNRYIFEIDLSSVK